jgi:hypothetical protein
MFKIRNKNKKRDAEIERRKEMDKYYTENNISRLTEMLVLYRRVNTWTDNDITLFTNHLINSYPPNPNNVSNYEYSDIIHQDFIKQFEKFNIFILWETIKKYSNHHSYILWITIYIKYRFESFHDSVWWTLHDLNKLSKLPDAVFHINIITSCILPKKYTKFINPFVSSSTIYDFVQKISKKCFRIHLDSSCELSIFNEYGECPFKEYKQALDILEAFDIVNDYINDIILKLPNADDDIINDIDNEPVNYKFNYKKGISHAD